MYARPGLPCAPVTNPSHAPWPEVARDSSGGTRIVPSSPLRIGTRVRPPPFFGPQGVNPGPGKGLVVGTLGRKRRLLARGTLGPGNFSLPQTQFFKPGAGDPFRVRKESLCLGWRGGVKTNWIPGRNISGGIIPLGGVIGQTQLAVLGDPGGCQGSNNPGGAPGAPPLCGNTRWGPRARVTL